MTRSEKITELRRRIAACDEALERIATTGVSSASLSSAGNSQSYTNLTLADIRSLRSMWASQLRGLVSGGLFRRTAPDFAP